jgi:glutamate synthase (ferredoxin)
MDMVVELLLMTGRSLPVMMMLVPEAWEKNAGMPDYKRAFMSIILVYGAIPSLHSLTDGTYIGAVLDRSGLRPSRLFSH